MSKESPNGRTKNKRQPLYQQVVRSLRDSIGTGELSPGALAPSESQLIAKFQVSSTTARRALNELAREGLIRRVQGKGSFITDLARSQTLRHIGVLYHDLLEMAGTFPSRALHGINRATERHDAQAVLMQFGQVRQSNDPAAALRAMAEHYRLDAMLLLSPAPAHWLTEVLDAGVPVAAPNFAYEHAAVISVTSDSQAAVDRLAKRLQQAGHQRVAALRGQFDSALVEGVRLNPYTLPRDMGIEWVEQHYAYFHENDVREQVTKLLAQVSRPTGFLCWGYEAALTVVDEVHQHGWHVPGDLSVAFIGVPPGPSRISGEVLPIEALTAAAVERLICRLDPSVAITMPSVFDSTPCEGRTLGPAARASSR